MSTSEIQQLITSFAPALAGVIVSYLTAVFAKHHWEVLTKRLITLGFSFIASLVISFAMNSFDLTHIITSLFASFVTATAYYTLLWDHMNGISIATTSDSAPLPGTGTEAGAISTLEELAGEAMDELNPIRSRS